MTRRQHDVTDGDSMCNAMHTMMCTNIFKTTSGAIVTLGGPWVVIMNNAVLFSPPIERCNHEAQAEHPPDDSDLHSVELAQCLEISTNTLWPPLLQPVPQDEFHHLCVLRAVNPTASH